jgi:hypothetical protein
VSTLDARPVLPVDAEAIAAIYAHHVLNGTATFDTEPPQESFWLEKIETLQERPRPNVFGDPMANRYAVIPANVVEYGSKGYRTTGHSEVHGCLSSQEQRSAVR